MGSKGDLNIILKIAKKIQILDARDEKIQKTKTTFTLKKVKTWMSSVPKVLTFWLILEL